MFATLLRVFFSFHNTLFFLNPTSRMPIGDCKNFMLVGSINIYPFIINVKCLSKWGYREGSWLSEFILRRGCDEWRIEIQKSDEMECFYQYLNVRSQRPSGTQIKWYRLHLTSETMVKIIFIKWKFRCSSVSILLLPKTCHGWLDT